MSEAFVDQNLSKNSLWADTLMEAVISSIQLRGNVGEYIELLSPKISFETSVFNNSRPSRAKRLTVKEHERSIIRSINILKHLMSGLQVKDIDTITEAQLVEQLYLEANPPKEIQELNELITRLKARKLDVFNAESIYTAYCTAYKVFSTTLNKQITHYNETYQGSLPLVGLLD